MTQNLFPMNNPAARVAAFFDGLNEAWNSPQETSDSDRNRRLLARALYLDSMDSAAVVSRLGELMEQVKILSVLIHEKKVSSLYDAMIPELNRYLDSLLGALNNQGMSNPQPLLALVVKLCAEQLGDLAPEAVPEEAELRRIRTEMAQLLADVVASEIDTTLKAFLSDELHKLLDGIDRFRISGVTPVRTAMVNLLITLETSSPVSPEAYQSEVAEEVTGRFQSLVTHLAALIGLAAAGTEIAAFVTHAIGPGLLH